MKQLNIKALIVYFLGLISFAGVILAAIFITNDGSLKSENNKSIVDRTNVIINMNQKKMQNYSALMTKKENSTIQAESSKSIQISSGKEIKNGAKNQNISENTTEKSEHNGFESLKNNNKTDFRSTKVSGRSLGSNVPSASISNSGTGIVNGPKIAYKSTNVSLNPPSMKIGNKQNIGGPPPSEHESPTLPLGDGWMLMLFFVGGYALFKLNTKSLRV